MVRQYERVEWTDNTPISKTLMQQMSDNAESINNKTKELETELRGKTGYLENLLNSLQIQMNQKVTLVHNCMNCGGQLNIEENKPVIHCKYCGSAYIIGTAQIHSTY